MIYKVTTKVNYYSEIFVESESVEEAKKKAENLTFDNMNDKYAPEIDQYVYIAGENEKA